jgi:GMP synthase (glutamine-hydrolysing)
VRVLFVEHPDGGGPGVFGDVVAMERWRAWCEEPPGGRFDAVAVYGGSHNVVGGPPWLEREIGWLRERVDAGVAVFGVCLGGQLLAAALGAEVTRALPPEIGWHPAWLTDAGREDPVLSVLGERFVACQWHSWTFALPERASLLALSAACPQAFRFGSSVGVQFHPEVDAPTLDRWIGDWRNDPDAVARGFDPDYARAEAAERLPAWNDAGRRLFAAFLEEVG